MIEQTMDEIVGAHHVAICTDVCTTSLAILGRNEAYAD